MTCEKRGGDATALSWWKRYWSWLTAEQIERVTFIPFGRLSVAAVKPSDVIIVEYDEPISMDVAARVTHYVEQAWPGHKVLVLHGGLRIRIAEGSNPPPHADVGGLVKTSL